MIYMHDVCCGLYGVRAAICDLEHSLGVYDIAYVLRHLE